MSFALPSPGHQPARPAGAVIHPDCCATDRPELEKLVRKIKQQMLLSIRNAGEDLFIRFIGAQPSCSDARLRRQSIDAIFAGGQKCERKPQRAALPGSNPIRAGVIVFLITLGVKENVLNVELYKEA
jgi:hypothetical protein